MVSSEVPDKLSLLVQETDKRTAARIKDFYRVSGSSCGICFNSAKIDLLTWHDCCFGHIVVMIEKRLHPARLCSLIAGACLVIGWTFFPAAAAGQEFPRGKLIESITCAADGAQSYALYLPSGFDPSRAWPVLVLFDPGARGPAAVDAFREAAETFGWIVAGSNNSRNGPMLECDRAARAVWADLQKRFALDPRRVYVAGFSGGARVASRFPLVIGRVVAGVIGCGAGLSSDVRPESLKAAAYFGLAGLADFNYEEMKALDAAFDPSGIPHRFLFFEGVHEWPAPSVCVRAAGWMEVMAVKAGLRSKDEALIAGVIGRELEEARSLENAGRIFRAVECLEAVRSLAEGFQDVPGLAARIEGLKSSQEFAKFLGAEKKRDKRTENFRAGFGRAFGALEGDEVGGRTAFGAVLKEMGIGFLKKEARQAKDIEDRGLASRLLFQFSFAAQTRGADLYDRGDLALAGAYYDLAIAACEEGLLRERYLYYSRACIASLMGEKKRALALLESAVAKGFLDLELLETDKDLDPIRTTERFREILAKARAGAKR
jgi:predicted esterase